MDNSTPDPAQKPAAAKPEKQTPPVPGLMHRIRSGLLSLVGLLIIVIPLFFAVSALGSRFGLWDWRFGFGTLTRNIGPKLLFLLLGTGVISLILAFVIKPRKGFFLGGLGVLMAVGAMGYAKSISVKAQSLPFIHDISTDTQNPPLFTNAIRSERRKTQGVNGLDRSQKRAPRTEELLSVAQVKAYPDVRSLIRPEDPDVLFAMAINTAQALGWDIVTQDLSVGIIEATDTTFWFGFKDDVVIRIVPGEGGGSVLDMRSVSRVGVSDVGKNAARIRAFSKHL